MCTHCVVIVIVLFCFCFVKVSSRFLWTGFHSSLTATLRPLNSCQLLKVTAGSSLHVAQTHTTTVHVQLLMGLWFCLPLTLCVLALGAGACKTTTDQLFRQQTHTSTRIYTYMCTWLITTSWIFCVHVSVHEHINEFSNLLWHVDNLLITVCNVSILIFFLFCSFVFNYKQQKLSTTTRSSKVCW